jgi:3',5'-cyclic AMP phosphodiesterase CpdA
LQPHRPSRRDVIRGAGGAALAGGVLSPLAASALAQEPRRTANNEGGFRFLFMPDFHLRREFGSAEGMEKALKAAMALSPKPAFVVTGGDLCQNLRDQTLPQCEEMADLFVSIWKKHVDVPTYHGLGNHDPAGWGKGLDSFPGGRDHPLFGFNLMLKKLNMPKPYYSFDHGGWHFVVLLNAKLVEPGKVIGEFDAEQIKFLRDDLSKAGKKPTMLFGHYPPVTAIEFFNGEAKGNEREARWELGYGRATRNPMALVEAIGDANVRAFFGGHIHRLDRITAKGVTFICSGSVSGDQWRGPDVDTEEGFAVVDCDPNGTFDYRYHEYGWDARK